MVSEKAVEVALAAEIDLMRDVYMSRAQREAYERILARALQQQQGGSEGVRGLVGKWRDAADYLAGNSALHTRKCADELEAALAAMGGQGAVAAAWDEGYRAGVDDERMSEASIGIAGFGAKVEPARNNPYRPPNAHTAPHQPEARVGGEVADPEPPSNEVWPPDGAVWLAPVATDAPADPNLMRYAWGRSNLSSGQMAEAYQCIVSAAQECGQVYRLPVTAPPAQQPEKE